MERFAMFLMSSPVFANSLASHFSTIFINFHVDSQAYKEDCA
jgi:hypothetical protein